MSGDLGKDEQEKREIEATVSAITFIAESALALAIRAHAPKDRPGLIDAFRSSAAMFSHLRAADDHEAEWQSDVFLLTQEKIEASLAKVEAVVGGGTK